VLANEAIFRVMNQSICGRNTPSSVSWLYLPDLIKLLSIYFFVRINAESILTV